MKTPAAETSTRPDAPDRDLASARNQLRREMRARRNALSGTDQNIAARNLARVIARHRLLKPGQRVAIYLRHRREIDPEAVIAQARRRHCKLYLPVVTLARTFHMEFVRFDETSRLHPNAFGILEPGRRRVRGIAVRNLDLVLLPLIAADPRGWRLGSGAGFYDRLLSRLRTERRWRRPKLIGMAYEFQRVAMLEPEPWDVPLDAVVTDRGFYPSMRSPSAE
jgi:5-formyltetrahydrofolate cyclo-ligase